MPTPSGVTHDDDDDAIKPTGAATIPKIDQRVTPKTLTD